MAKEIFLKLILCAIFSLQYVNNNISKNNITNKSEEIKEFRPNINFSIRLNYLSKKHFFDFDSSYIKIGFLVTEYDKFKPGTKILIKITDKNNKEVFSDTIPEKYYFNKIEFESPGIHKISFINGGKTGVKLNLNIEQGSQKLEFSNFVKKEHLNDTKTLVEDIELKMMSLKSILDFKQKSNENRFKNLLGVNRYYLLSAVLETAILIIISFLQLRYLRQLKL